MTTDLVVTVQDLHSVPDWSGRVGYCARGARAWCDRHGFDWAAAVRDGIPAAALLATGDAMAQRLVDHALARGGPRE